MKPTWTAVTHDVLHLDGLPNVTVDRYNEPLPPERRMVMVQIDRSESEAPCVAVGYLKFAAGDRECPFFVVPGALPHFVVTHWADCLGDDFEAPLWGMRNEPSDNSSNQKGDK